MGGVVGAARTAAAASIHRIIGFDMGGTSTDVSHYDGSFERDFDTEIAGVRLRAPMMRMHTIAAGGGSVLRFHNQRFQVGPDSAGADPGPAAYRRGGPLTVTDANVMTGKLNPAFFPAVFGPSQDQPLDAQIVRTRFAELAAEIGDGRSNEEIADGFLQIAVDNMANTIRKISVQRGRDITGYSLACFGGAAGQHACAVADALGMTRIHIHPLSGVLSAYGIGLAPILANRSRAVLIALGAGDAAARIAEAKERLAAEASADVISQSDGDAAPLISVRAHVRYDGSDTTLPIQLSDSARTSAGSKAIAIVADFEAEHRRQFGFAFAGKPMVLETLEVEASVAGAEIAEREQPLTTSAAMPAGRTRFFDNGDWHDAPVHRRQGIHPGHHIDGPALIIEPHQTIVIAEGWRAEITARDDILLTRDEPKNARGAIGTEADPMMLELFSNRFMVIAEEMGIALKNTAQSVNIKERLDFSCVIFNANGDLIANAPHVPVHLGSMDRSVATIIARNHGKVRPGDVFALNAAHIYPISPSCRRYSALIRRSTSGSPRAATMPTLAVSPPAR